MITYGTKRKKNAKPVTFSSDESEDEESAGNSSRSGLPFALSPRKSPGSKVVLNNSPNKRINIQELAANDPLTKSPRKFMRTIDSMQSERLARLHESRGRNTSPGSSPSTSPSRSPSPTPVPRKNVKTYKGSKSAASVSKLKREAGPQQGSVDLASATDIPSTSPSRSPSPTSVPRKNVKTYKGSKFASVSKLKREAGPQQGSVELAGATDIPSTSPSRSPSPTPVPRKNVKTYKGSKSAGSVSKLKREAGPQQGSVDLASATVMATERRDGSKVKSVSDSKPRQNEILSKKTSILDSKASLKDELGAWDSLFSTLSDKAKVANKKPVAARKLSSKSPSAWDDLFSNLKENNVEKLDIITKLSKDLVRLEGQNVVDGGDSSDSDCEADTTVSSYLLEESQVLSAPTRQNLSPPFSVSKSLSVVNEINPLPKLATYGNVRSFLEGEGDGNQVAEENAAELDAEPLSKDIHDLKSLGKMQMETEEMEYLFDSLAFVVPPSTNTSIESCNQVLINILVDLCMDIWNNQESTIAWKDKQDVLLRHLLERLYLTWKVLAKSMNQTNGRLIESLILILIYGISITKGENIDINEAFLGQRLTMMDSSSISISIEPYTLLSQTTQNINQLTSIINSTKILDQSKIVGLLAKEVCEKSKNPDFQFFKVLAKFFRGQDIQLAIGLVHGCNNISNIFELINDDDECLETIVKFLEWGELEDGSDLEEDREIQLKVLEVLVVLSTKIDLHSKELLGVIVSYQTKVVKGVLLPNLSTLDDKISSDLAILALGYLLNLAEFCTAQGIQIEFLPYIQDIFLKLPNDPSNEIEIHINGYFALIVAILKVDLFDRELMIDHLTKFKKEISNIGSNKIYEKISFELKILVDGK